MCRAAFLTKSEQRNSMQIANFTIFFSFLKILSTFSNVLGSVTRITRNTHLYCIKTIVHFFNILIVLRNQ